MACPECNTACQSNTQYYNMLWFPVVCDSYSIKTAWLRRIDKDIQ